MKQAHIWIIIAIGALILYFLWSRQTVQEQFTNVDLDLAKKILAYLQQTPNSFIGYVNLLVANNNASTNLPKVETYDALVAKGKSLTVADILAKF
jgi:hypothetical protein